MLLSEQGEMPRSSTTVVALAGERDPVSQLVHSPLLLDEKLKAQPAGAIQVKGCHKSLSVPSLLTRGLSIYI